jgi:hypothetical protein
VAIERCMNGSCKNNETAVRTVPGGYSAAFACLADRHAAMRKMV